jgi:hypothetical protein
MGQAVVGAAPLAYRGWDLVAVQAGSDEEVGSWRGRMAGGGSFRAGRHTRPRGSGVGCCLGVQVGWVECEGLLVFWVMTVWGCLRDN